jgi:hypothetical protein
VSACVEADSDGRSQASQSVVREVDISNETMLTKASRLTVAAACEVFAAALPRPLVSCRQSCGVVGRKYDFGRATTAAAAKARRCSLCSGRQNSLLFCTPRLVDLVLFGMPLAARRLGAGMARQRQDSAGRTPAETHAHVNKSLSQASKTSNMRFKTTKSDRKRLTPGGGAEAPAAKMRPHRSNSIQKSFQ